jgi:hypothetical protein
MESQRQSVTAWGRLRTRRKNIGATNPMTEATINPMEIPLENR